MSIDMGIFPLVKYARMMNKNTAEFNLSDFAKYMKWWMKQPVDFKMLEEIKREEIKRMNSKTSKQINNEIVVEMGLTQVDIDALSWGIKQLLEVFDFSEMREIGDSLITLEKSLESFVTKGE